MLCEICHENEARVTYTEIINGVKKEQHLCESCAAKQAPFNLMGKLGPEVQFGNILSGLLQSFAKGLNAMQEKESICGRCGMTASEFAKTGKLGCPDCYGAFAPILDKNLRTLQGAVDNKSKKPMNAVYYEPVIYDPGRNRNNDGEQKDGNETGEVLGTAGTIDDILGTPEPENTAGRRRRKAGSETAVDAKKPAGKNNTAAGTKKPAEKNNTAAGTGKSGNAAKGKSGESAETIRLRKLMEKAVKAENYEEAARLRDRLHAVGIFSGEADEAGPKTTQTGKVADKTGPKTAKAGKMADGTGSKTAKTGKKAEKTGPKTTQTGEMADGTGRTAGPRRRKKSDAKGEK